MECNTLDKGIMVILIISGILGYKKGLMASLRDIISTIIGLGIAFFYRNEAVNYLQEHYGVVSGLASFLEQRLSIPAWGSTQSHTITSLPQVIEGLSYVHRQFTGFASLLVGVLCFVLLYIISSRLIKLVFSIGEKIFGSMRRGGINSFGGAGIVIVQNIVGIAVLLGLLNPLLSVGAEIGIKTFSQASVYMQNSVMTPYFMKIYAFMQTMIVMYV